MPRYESRPKAFWDDDDFACQPAQAPTIVVIDHERHERRTGLLDARGNPIVAIEEMEPIGFRRTK